MSKLTNQIMGLLGKEAKSLMKSQVRSSVKKKTGSFLKKFFAKSALQIQEEVDEMMGYPTIHYTVDKDQNPKMKVSSMMIQEWLMESPVCKGKVLKDEETDRIFFDGEELNAAKKVELIQSLLKTIGSPAQSIQGNFESALKLLPVDDLTAQQFKHVFAGWNPNHPSIIDEWLEGAFGSGLTTDLQYSKMLWKKWVVGTARRALTPGESLDGCLTLVGPSNLGKTLHFRHLLPEPFANRTGEILGDIKSPQKFVEGIIGKTIACFDELSILDNDRVEETFKQLLSSTAIDVRMVYKRTPQRYLLRQGFAATTNQKAFIKDPHLSRRMWCLELNDTKQLDFDFLYMNRFKLWQEAVYLAKDKSIVTYLTQEQQRQVEAMNLKYHA